MDTRLLWLALGGFAGGYEGFLIGSLLPAIGADMGVTIGEAGLAAFAYALTYAIGTPILATVLGHVDRRTLLICAELTFACGAVMLVFAPSLPVAIAARVVIALGAGTFTATAIATAVAMSPPERRGRSIAVVAGGQSLAVLLGVPLGALVVATYGWRVAYVTIAVIALLAVTGLALRMPRGILGDRIAIRERLSVVGLPGIPSALLTTLLFMVPAYMPIIFIAPLAAYAAGMGLEMLPLALLANGIGAVTGTQFGGRIADRLGARRAVVLAAAAQIVLLLILATAGLLPSALGLPVFLFVMLAAGLVGWGFWPSQSSLIAGLVPGSPALALSLNLTALNIGVALAARIGGVVVDQSNAAWLAVVGIPFALAALLVARFVIPVRKAPA